MGLARAWSGALRGGGGDVLGTAGVRVVRVPEDAVPEAGLVDVTDVDGAATLGRVLAWFERAPVRARPSPPPVLPVAPLHDLADVVGQDDARRALEVASA